MSGLIKWLFGRRDGRKSVARWETEDYLTANLQAGYLRWEW